MPQRKWTPPIWARVGAAAAAGVYAAAQVLAILLLTFVDTEAMSPMARLFLATGVAFALAITAFLATALTIAPLGRRLRQVAQAARKFAAGAMDHRLRIPLDEELHDLAQSLNTMAEQISLQFSQLRAQQNEQEAILRSMEGGVLAIDGEMRVLRINRVARDMFRTGDDDVRDRPLFDVITDPALRRFATDAIADPSRRVADIAARDTPGLQVRAISGALLDAEDEPVGAIILLTDVTQLKRLETMRAEFAANVSHELRTPITNIKGYAQTLVHEPEPEPQTRRRFLTVINRNAERLDAIVSDLLDLTKLEYTDLASLPAAPANVATILASSRSQVAANADERGVRIVVDAPDHLHARVNARLVEQAVINLLSNAIKYGVAEGTVSLRAASATLPDERAAVEITVTDQGPGIEPEHLPRLFERFYRIDRARSRESGGTGLGLSIVKHIAIIHGGLVRVDSTPGVGSAFRILLPATEAPEPEVLTDAAADLA